MASYNKLPSGYWRVQVRRKGQYASSTFRRKSDAEAWALQRELAAEGGKSIVQLKLDDQTFGDLIDLHVSDLAEVGKPLLRSKRLCLEKLKTMLGHVALKGFTRERLIEFGKRRAREGAGPVTLGIDIGYIRTILVHAAAVHGLEVPTENVILARVALNRLSLTGKGQERDRRPAQDEIDRILQYSDDNMRQVVPLSRIIKFAIATAMRQDEICCLLKADVNLSTGLALVRDRKDPRRKSGNHQKVPLLDVTGYSATTLVREQLALGLGGERLFPYNGRTVGHAFRRTCKALNIEDLRFHDLRHEGTSRLFEAGFEIPEVSLVTGHKDWKMLRRYLNLDAHQLLQRKAVRPRYL